MRRLLVALMLLVLLTVGYFAFFPVGQRADRAFDARVAHPAYITWHPLVVFDEAHYNAHSIRGNFEPFAGLLRNDGYRIERGRARFTQASLAGVDVRHRQRRRRLESQALRIQSGAPILSEGG
jgi:hypothetical protein